MPGEIMLFGVNRKTRRSRKSAKRARRHNLRRARRSSHKRRRAATVQVYAPNPKRRHRRHRIAHFKRNPKRRRASGFSSGLPSSGNIMNMVKVAAIAGSGAVLLDIGYNYLPLPPSLKAGPVSHLVKGAGAILLALGAKRFVGAKMANELAFGALTVTLYGALRAAANTAVPSLKLGMYDDLGMYLDGEMLAGGMHPITGHLNGLGYYGAGQVTSPAMMAAGQPQDLQGEFRQF